MIDSLVTSLYDNNSIQLQRAPPVGWVAAKSQQGMDNISVKLPFKAVKMLWLYFPSSQKRNHKIP